MGWLSCTFKASRVLSGLWRGYLHMAAHHYGIILQCSCVTDNLQLEIGCIWESVLNNNFSLVFCEFTLSWKIILQRFVEGIRPSVLGLSGFKLILMKSKNQETELSLVGRAYRYITHHWFIIIISNTQLNITIHKLCIISGGFIPEIVFEIIIFDVTLIHENLP